MSSVTSHNVHIAKIKISIASALEVFNGRFCVTSSSKLANCQRYLDAKSLSMNVLYTTKALESLYIEYIDEVKSTL